MADDNTSALTPRQSADAAGATNTLFSSPAASSNNETLSMLDRAEKLHKETLEAEKRISEHRQRIEEIETRRIMGGNSQAGSVHKSPEEVKREEIEKQVKERVSKLI